MMRRETRYPERLSLNLSAETMRSLRSASQRYQISAAVLARGAIEAGWPAVRDRLRKSARIPPRNPGGTERPENGE